MGACGDFVWVTDMLFTSGGLPLRVHAEEGISWFYNEITATETADAAYYT